MPLRNYILFTVGIALLPFFAKADNALNIRSEDRIYFLKDFANLYVPSDEIDLENYILTNQNQLFKNSIKKVSPSNYINANKVWAKFTFQNATNEKIYLQVANPNIDEIILYSINGKTLNKEVHTGVSQDNRLVNMRQNKYFIELKNDNATPKTYILVVKDNKALGYIDFHISALRTFFEKNTSTILLQGMFYGIILFLCFYSLFQFYNIRDFSFVYFGLYALTIGLFFLLHKGYTFEYFLGELALKKQYEELLACAAGLLAILMTNIFLKTVINTPRKHLWLLCLNIFFIISALLYLFNASMLAPKILTYNTVLALVFILIISYSNIKNGFTPAIYFFWSWLIFAASLAIVELREMGVFHYNTFTNNILQVGGFIHISLLSFALAKKMRIIIDKKNEAQEVALKTAIENEKLITHQKQLLETKVFERTKDLEQSINTLKEQEEELKEASNFKDKVFSIISHDLKSPLSTLTGLMELLKLKSISEEEKGKILNNVDAALKNTRNLLENILAWANPKMKQQEQKSEVDAYAYVNEIFQLFRVQSDSKKINLRNNIDPGKTIYTEQNTYRLVLRNLISNALKFTPVGGEIKINLEEYREDVIVSVHDNGIGIQESMRKKLFENDNHFSTRGTENEKGTGIGLMLCKEFVEKNNGSIWAEKNEGKGTTFYVKLKNALINESQTYALG